MERLGGNTALLDTLLGKFISHYGAVRTDLETLCAEHRLGEAHRLIHSIKGVSANLGFAEVYRNAAALDLKIKEGSFDPDWDETKLFLDSMDSILLSLNSWLTEREPRRES